MSGGRTARSVRLIPTLLSTVLVLTGLSLVAVPPTPAVADPPPPTVSERYADKVMDDDPAAYYRLDDATTGFVRDSSGNFRDGTHGANVTANVDGALPGEGSDDKALSNAGPDWAFTVPGTGLPSGSSARSLEVWFKSTSTSTGWLAHYGGWGIYRLGANSLRVDPPGCCSELDVTTHWTLADGTWHQMVLTRRR